jgi:hypothetical protein
VQQAEARRLVDEALTGAPEAVAALPVEQREVDEVAALTGLQAAAISTRRSRLHQRAREIHDSLESACGPTAHQTDASGACS